MAAKLPVVGGDSGNWGTILNEYLTVEHGTDGLHKMGSGLVTENVTTVADASTSLTLTTPTTSTLLVITLTADCSVTLPSAVAGQSFTLVVKQNASGNHVITWIGSVKWPSAVTPVLTTSANAIDVFGFFSIDGTSWIGSLSIQDAR